MNKLWISLVFFLIPGISGIVLAGDFEELTASCESCHGPDGASPYSDVPTIGGQSTKYISDSLESFQIWGRPCVKSAYRSGDTSKPKTDMCKIAGGLSSEDIQKLSEHYSSRPWVAAPQKFDASRAPPCTCKAVKHVISRVAALPVSGQNWPANGHPT